MLKPLTRTFNDPLASKVRSTLRRDYGFSRTVPRHYSVPCVFSTEQLRYPKPDGSICLQKSFVGDGVKLDCAGGFGAVMMVTATFGMVAATKAVDKIVAGMRRPSEKVKQKQSPHCRDRYILYTSDRVHRLHIYRLETRFAPRSSLPKG